MSYARPHRPRSVAALAGLSALAGLVAAPAAEAITLRLPKLNPPTAIRALPAPRIALPDDFSVALRYGTDDAAVIASLDDSRTAVASDVDRTATRVAADRESKVSIEQCAGAGLKNAGEGYRDRVREAADALQEVPAPDFQEVGGLVAGCLQESFEVPAEAAFDLAMELADQQAVRGIEVLQASGSAAVLAEWMVVGGEGIEEGATAAATPPVVGSGAEDTSTATDDGSVPWAVILVVIAVAGIAGAAYLRSRPGRA